MAPRTLYATLAVAGTVLPYSQLFRQPPPSAGSLVHQLFDSPFSGLFVMDVFVSAAVVIVFVFVESRRQTIRHVWLPLTALVTVGVSLALPLFLYMREAQQTGASVSATQ